MFNKLFDLSVDQAHLVLSLEKVTDLTWFFYQLSSLSIALTKPIVYELFSLVT